MSEPNPDLPYPKKPEVKIYAAHILTDECLALPFDEFVAATERYIDRMRTGLINRAKDEWFKRQALYTTPTEFTRGDD